MVDLGRYPFLSRGRELAREKGLSGIGETELIDARARVASSVGTAASGKPPAPEGVLLDEKKSVVSYALGRLLLGIADSEYYWGKFARGEAILAHSYLKAESPAGLLEVANDFFPSAESAGSGFRLKLADYLAYGMRLSKEPLEKGFVYASAEALVELLKSSVYRRAKERPPAMKEVPALFKQHAQELLTSLPKPLIQADYSGSFLSLPCMRAISAGVGEGKRYYASMALAIACRKDGLSREKAAEVMRAFVQGCNKTTHPFTEREAIATLDWVYRRGDVKYNCDSLRSHGLCPPECAFPCTLDRARRAQASR